ncbi:MAG: hypothetical protein KBT28_06930 [Bacteroidales bacterium]|nr:hypothetical protein [Candidatus Colimorpha merdihippi]
MKLNVLVACEESQRVCSAFRKLGHNAFSCDLQECSGGHPEWHIHGDCFDAFNMPERRLFFGEEVPVFYTQDGNRHTLPRHKWDLVIGHPPCTYLSNSGQRFCDESRYGDKAAARKQERIAAINFFIHLAALDCDHIAIENPLGIMSDIYDEPDQIIQPWQFSLSDNVQKSTCLWLKGLPPLQPIYTERPFEPDVVTYTNREGKTRKMERFFYESRFMPTDERRKYRSKTFHGIASAMASQWSQYLMFG